MSNCCFKRGLEPHAASENGMFLYMRRKESVQSDYVKRVCGVLYIESGFTTKSTRYTLTALSKAGDQPLSLLVHV